MARTKQAVRVSGSKRPGKTSSSSSKSSLKGDKSTQALNMPRKHPKVHGSSSLSSKLAAASATASAATSESDSEAHAESEPEAEAKKPRKWSRETLYKRRVRKAQQQLNDGHALLNESAAIRCIKTAIDRSDMSHRPIRLKISAVRTIHDAVDTCMTQIFSHAHDIVRQSDHTQLNDKAVALAAQFWANHNDLSLLHGANEILKSEFHGARLL